MTKETNNETKTNTSATFPFLFSPDAFAQFAREHMTRVEGWMKEITTMEETMVARLKANTAQASQLAQDSIEYVTQLSGEWRKMASDVARRAADITLPKA